MTEQEKREIEEIENIAQYQLFDLAGDSNDVAKALYKAGYRKIPDSATALLVGKDNHALDEKTIEVRKSAPKLKTPFKVYVYCTKHHDAYDLLEWHLWDSGKIEKMNCKVVGEFVCDKITKIDYDEISPIYQWGATRKGKEILDDILVKSCLCYVDIVDYLDFKDGYAWRISELKIYDKPKELSEFHKPLRRGNFKCTECGYFEYYAGIRRRCNLDWSLKRPPKSWCYVEELKR